MQHYLNYFDGQWRDSSRQLEVTNPATAQAFATVAQASIDDADAAMSAAHLCASSGALTDVRPAQRTAWLLKAADAIREIAEEGALILCRENGKTWKLHEKSLMKLLVTLSTTQEWPIKLKEFLYL